MRPHPLNHMVAKNLNISHVDGRHCRVAWSHATLSMLFSFCSVSVPIPLCCHLLSLGPCGGLLARFCGVQSGCRGAVEVGGWIMASMLTRHTSNLHHPDTSGSCMSPPSMLHTHCPPLPSSACRPQEPQLSSVPPAHINQLILLHY